MTHMMATGMMQQRAQDNSATQAPVALSLAQPQQGA